MSKSCGQNIGLHKMWAQGSKKKNLGYGMFNVRTLSQNVLFLTSSLPSEPLKTLHGKLTLQPI